MTTSEAITTIPLSDNYGASTLRFPTTGSSTKFTPALTDVTVGGDDSEYEVVLFDKPVWHLTLLGIIYGILIILTVVGNIFVMVAYHRDVRIRRNVANAFILNLAIGDFIVGAFIWPIYLAWNIVGTWIFGEYLCKVWSFVDYTVTAVSVLTIILISLDRYWLLSKTTGYAAYQTKWRVNVTIATCWIVVSAIFLLVIFGWSAFTKRLDIDYRYDCDAEFIYTFPSLITAVAINFVIPAIIIATINVTVYFKIRARARGLDQLKNKIVRASKDKTQFNNRSMTSRLNIFRRTKKSTLPTAASDGKGLNTGVILLSIDNTKPKECHINPGFDPKVEVSHSSSSEGTSGIGSGQEAPSGSGSGSDPLDNKDDYDDDNADGALEEDANSRGENKQEVFSISQQNRERSGSPVKSKSTQLDKLRKKLKQKQKEFSRERKAAFILAVLVSVFVLCWLPFNLTAVVGVICNYECIPANVFIVTENLVWANSALNPILYAATNVHYRRNFLTFLGCRRLARKLDGASNRA